ncbi:MAG: hypothetical protein AAGA62_01995, partial [Bacteroidota bacterium]
ALTNELKDAFALRKAASASFDFSRNLSLSGLRFRHVLPSWHSKSGPCRGFVIGTTLNAFQSGASRPSFP